MAYSFGGTASVLTSLPTPYPQSQGYYVSPDGTQLPDWMMLQMVAGCYTRKLPDVLQELRDYRYVPYQTYGGEASR